METTTTQETPQQETPAAARRGRGRPRLLDPSRELRVRAPSSLARRLEAALPTSDARRGALLEAIELVLARHETSAPAIS